MNSPPQSGPELPPPPNPPLPCWLRRLAHEREGGYGSDWNNFPHGAPSLAR